MGRDQVVVKDWVGPKGGAMVMASSSMISASPLPITWLRRCTHGTRSSRRFQIRPRVPPGFRTRAASAVARSTSTQCQAWATVMTSTELVGEGDLLRGSFEGVDFGEGGFQRRSHLVDRLDRDDVEAPCDLGSGQLAGARSQVEDDVGS
jgi:hypothetical protein